MIEVAYCGHLGSDLFVVNAARRSFDNQHTEWSETPRGRRGRSDTQLVSDLARDGHLLPFRHPQITLACTAPLPVARQLGKHQIGMSWSEVSRRYKTDKLTFHEIGHWRAAPAEKRQGSGEAIADGAVQNTLAAIQWRNIRRSLAEYEQALEMGASPEQARFLLPQSMDVRWTWTGSLLAWAHLYAQRTHPDAQAETREFALLVADVVEPLFPVSWAALAGWRPEAEQAA
jgi:thymidylate synthase (FAD)